MKKSLCVISVKGEPPYRVYPVNICFDSLKSEATALLKENQQLLNVIVEKPLQSVTELAALAGLAVSNVSRTQETLANYNLVGTSNHKIDQR
ncbi:HVO_A0114 family putative DNA-binding protein [Vibrio mediterranei]|uniref:HVO_A0114 family putative DNA-binding protein n=1 Tax=Vibrio mediterranei TaxID=689 RepID=UPI004068F167